MTTQRSIADLTGTDSVQLVQASLLDTLTRAFTLKDEEVAWAAYKISVLLTPYEGMTVKGVPTARLVKASSAPRVGADRLDPVKVGLDAWVDSLTNLVRASYDLDDLDSAGVRAQLRAILTDLGVGDPDTPRPARYIPRDVLLRRA